MFYLWAKGTRRKPSTSAPWLHQSGAKDKTPRSTETERRRSGQEKPGVTQSERSSSPWCKGRVSLTEAEGRTLILQRQQAGAETCKAAHRAEAALCLSIGGLSRTHWAEVGERRTHRLPLSLSPPPHISGSVASAQLTFDPLHTKAACRLRTAHLQPTPGDELRRAGSDLKGHQWQISQCVKYHYAFSDLYVLINTVHLLNLCIF